MNANRSNEKVEFSSHESFIVSFFPLHELFEHDNIRWVSISTRDIDKEIEAALERKRSIVDVRLDSEHQKERQALKLP